MTFQILSEGMKTSMITDFLASYYEAITKFEYHIFQNTPYTGWNSRKKCLKSHHRSTDDQ